MLLNILQQILSFNSNFGVAVDLNWTKSYEKRIDNPIELAGKVLIKNKKIIEFSENLQLEHDNNSLVESCDNLKFFQV
mgnify:CR=1 FL=1